jgi:hypothetical protein
MQWMGHSCELGQQETAAACSTICQQQRGVAYSIERQDGHHESANNHQQEVGCSAKLPTLPQGSQRPRNTVPFVLPIHLCTETPSAHNQIIYGTGPLPLPIRSTIVNHVTSALLPLRTPLNGDGNNTHAAHCQGHSDVKSYQQQQAPSLRTTLYPGRHVAVVPIRLVAE